MPRAVRLVTTDRSAMQAPPLGKQISPLPVRALAVPIIAVSFLGPAGTASPGAAPATHEPNAAAASTADADAQGTIAAISRLRLSDALADFGEHAADPLALIEAAKLRKMLPAPLDSSAGAGIHARTVESLLRRAKQLAGENPTIDGLIADVRAYKRRDIPTLPDDVQVMRKVARANSADRAEVRFKAGESAVVYIHPDAAAELSLFVYDEFNNLICAEDGTAQAPLCHWRPRWNGRFLLDIHNNSVADVPYQLAINRELVGR